MTTPPVTMPSPTIRPFVADDLPALQRIREAAFAPVFRSFREIVGPQIAMHAFAAADTDQARLLDDICDAGSAHRVRVVEAAGQVVGFVTFTINASDQVGEIGLNAVDPAHAGRGIGSWMYRLVLAEMQTLGAVVATVGVGGDPSHAAARSAYSKAGFGPGIPSLTLYRLLAPGTD
ncbi:MAG: GNAT family N-acetyltransferase [Bauldia sp.]|nr:GNAT family N-acetyltransferase [Bauldia sp.]